MTVQLIAEFCQNHNGNYDLLAKMVEAAAKSGATYGKMQFIYANTLAFRSEFEEGLIQNGAVKAIKRPYIEEKKRLKQLEIDEKKTTQFVKLCIDHGLKPLTTCFVRAHAKAIREAGFKSIKIASYDCASFSLLREIKPNFDEVIVSTGATYDDEIEYACNILKGINFSLLHCVTIYPTPLDQVHLSRMDFLRKFTPNVGFSDHSLVSETGVIAAKAALAMGATKIERHFTLLESGKTKDGPVSIRPEDLTELANFASLSIEERISHMNIKHPSWKITIGQKDRKLSEQELLNRDYYRGRFASPRPESVNGNRMIFNWEETKLP